MHCEVNEARVLVYPLFAHIRDYNLELHLWFHEVYASASMSDTFVRLHLSI